MLASQKGKLTARSERWGVLGASWEGGRQAFAYFGWSPPATTDLAVLVVLVHVRRTLRRPIVAVLLRVSAHPVGVGPCQPLGLATPTNAFHGGTIQPAWLSCRCVAAVRGASRGSGRAFFLFWVTDTAGPEPGIRQSPITTAESGRPSREVPQVNSPVST